MVTPPPAITAGVGFVLDGGFESAFGADATVAVSAGQGFVDLAGVPHRLFRNASAQRALRFVIAYTLPVGEEAFHLTRPWRPPQRARPAPSRPRH